MLLTGKVVIVSGVGAGLGREIARALVGEGARVVVVARDGERLQRVALDLGGQGSEVVGFAGDMTDRTACERIVDATVERFGKVDGLVNNAVAYGDRGPIMEADLGAWRELFEINVIGTLQMTRSVLTRMAERARGSIVMVGSMVTEKSGHGAPGYAASKGGLLTAARELAAELGPSGTRVNSVVPGWMLGPRVEQLIETEAARRGVDPATVRDEIASRSALHKIPTLAECAYPVAFLLSDKAAAITGQEIHVSAGELLF